MPSEEDEPTDNIDTAQCGACQEEIPADSESCPKCNVSFSGVKDVDMGECGSCKAIVPLNSKSCPNCDIAFVLDDLLQSVNSWMKSDGLTVADVFGKWDHNDDGVLSGYEIKKGLIEAEIAVLPKNEIERFIHQLDLDNDSMISLTELNTALMLDDGDSSGETDSSDDSSDVESDSEDEEGSDDEADEEESGQDDDSDDDSNDEEEESDDVSDDEDEESDDSDEEESDDDSDDEDEESDDSDDEDEESDDSDEEESDDDSDEDESDDDSDEDDSDDEDEESDDSDEDESDEESDDEDEPTLIDQLSKLVRESDDNIRSSFNDFDSNNDQRISAEEFRKTIEKHFSDSFDEESIDELMQALDEDEDGTVDLIEFVDGIESPDTVNEAIEEKKKPDGPTEAQIWLMRNEENIFPIGWSVAGLTLIMSIINIYGFFSALFSCNEGENAWLLNNEWCANHTKLNILNIFSPGDPASWSEKGTWGIPDILLVLILVALIGGSIWFRSIVKGWKIEYRKKKTSGISDEEDETEENDDSDDEVSNDGDEDSEGDGSEDEDTDDDPEDDEDSDGDESEDEDSDDDEDADIEIGSKVGVDHEGEEWNGVIIEFDEDDDEVLVKDNDSGEEYWVPFDALFVD